MTDKATVSEFMTPAPATVSEDLFLADALDRMYQSNIRHLPVVNEKGDLTGVVTTRDVALAASVRGMNPDRTPISSIVAHKPYACTANTSLLEIVAEMEKNRYGSVVITEEDKPVGVFTTTDALRALRTVLTGEAVEPLVVPEHERPDPAEAGAAQSRARMRTTGGSKYGGMVSWFLARL